MHRHQHQSYRLRLTILSALVAAAAAACAVNPLSVAQTPEQKAFALYGNFVVATELAAEMVVDPAVPTDVRTDIRRVNAQVRPVVDSLLAAAEQVQRVRAQFQAGAADQAAVLVVISNLEEWIAQAEPALARLTAVIQQ